MPFPPQIIIDPIMADAVSQMIGEVGTSIIDRRADYVLNLSLSGHFHSLTISESQFNPK